MLDTQVTSPKLNKVIVMVAAHEIWNYPQFRNIAYVFAANGYKAFVIGYKKGALPTLERISHNAWILRIDLRSRRIPLAPVRKMLSVIEFIAAASEVINRIKPIMVITFSDPAAILLKIKRGDTNFRKINWLLEFPEFEIMNVFERLLIRLSTSCWKYADVMVTPTKERLALSLALHPSCLQQKHFVVHNSPSKFRTNSKHLSSNCRAAQDFLEERRSEGDLTIIYSGAVGVRYGVDSLIKAVGGIQSGVAALVVGLKHQSNLKEINDALKQIPYPGNIHWVDVVAYTELQEILSYADAGFVTYRGDTLNTLFSAPGKIYEYIKAGLVVITDETSCINSELSDYGCGIYFPRPVTDEGVFMAIKEMVKSKDRVPEMKRASLKLYDEKLKLELQIQPLLEFENTKYSSK